MKTSKKAIVIGAGFGGLATAIRLQSAGYSTIILEKNSMPGGQAMQHKEKGYTFDLGPSIITEPKIIESVFKAAGKKMEDYVDLMPLDPVYRIYFHDGTFIDYNSNREYLKEQIGKYNNDDALKLDDFMNYSKKMYDEVITNGFGKRSFNSFKEMLRFAPFAILNKAFLSAHTVVAQYFKDFRTRFLFSFHALFIGGSPFNAPAVFLMLPYLEQYQGVWFAKGGMFSLVKAFEKVFLQIGGEIIYNSEVTKVNIEKSKVQSVNANDKNYNCDILVSNAHFAHTYKDLIPQNQRKVWKDSKIKSFDYSMSCVLLYLGVTKKYSKLLHHTLVISKDYKKLISELFANKGLSEEFSMYIHAPSKTDATLAPENCESIYVLIPTPNLKANIDWDTQKEPFTKKVLNFIENDFGLTDLQKHIEVKKVFTPKDFETHRNNYLGAAWSLQPKLTQIATFRPHSKSEEFENLYLVGASTHPGGGVPGVLLSAEATTSVILKDYENN